ncbi:hypothetical protein ACQEU8_02420 [Streptomyces sp. CA-250714]|uniref:hypothetical protein n=1 Tax=Streptomyces sp. CA-250714 TaxID=3240060 RepID=UPI003D9255F1
MTSIKDLLGKPFLAPWQAKMAAELAVDSLDYIAEMARRDKQGAVDYIKGAARRYSKIRQDVGSEAHDLFERILRGEAVGAVSRDMAPYKRHFAEFLAAAQPELVRAEDVAWSDTHEYAGSFDAILRILVDERGELDSRGEPALVMADWKTGKSTYPEVALQMAAYAHADKIISPDGSEAPMPEFDGAVVLHITDEKWALKPVRIDRPVFDYFLHLRALFEWDREHSKSVIGKSLAASGGRLVTGTERRR